MPRRTLKSDVRRIVRYVRNEERAPDLVEGAIVLAGAALALAILYGSILGVVAIFDALTR